MFAIYTIPMKQCMFCRLNKKKRQEMWDDLQAHQITEAWNRCFAIS